MHTANVNDTGSLGALYSREAFAFDAGMNSTGKAPALRGLRIFSAPDPYGTFHVARATPSLGERPAPGAVFICPYMGRAYGIFAAAVGVHGPVVERLDPFEQHPEEYDAFLAHFLRTVRESDALRVGATASATPPRG